MALIYFWLILTLSFLYFRIKSKRKRELISNIPSLSSLPILDHALHFKNKQPEEIVEFLFELSKKLGKVFYVSILGNVQHLIISDPKISEQILSSSKGFMEKPIFYGFIKNWLGNALPTGNQNWHQKRKLFTPVFHLKILEQYIDIFDKHGDVFVDKLMKTQGREIDVFHLVSFFALDVICGI